MAQVKSTQQESEFQPITLEVTIENRAEFELLFELTSRSNSLLAKPIQKTLESQGLNYSKGEQVSQKIFNALYNHRY